MSNTSSLALYNGLVETPRGIYYVIGKHLYRLTFEPPSIRRYKRGRKSFVKKYKDILRTVDTPDDVRCIEETLIKAFLYAAYGRVLKDEREKIKSSLEKVIDILSAAERCPRDALRNELETLEKIAERGLEVREKRGIRVPVEPMVDIEGFEADLKWKEE